MGTYYNDNGTLGPIAGRGSGVNRNDVAYVETGTTASRNYAVGQLVYVSGAMYRVKSAIQSGQTFTVGTNIEATTIGGEIQRINNDLSVETIPLTWHSSLTTVNVSAYKIGKLVTISGYISTDGTQLTASEVFANVPALYRPKALIHGSGMIGLDVTSTAFRTGKFRVGTDGNIQQASTNQFCNGSFSLIYPC